MRAEGRCRQWLRKGLLLGLLAQGCERGTADEPAPRPDAAVPGGNAAAPRFDLQRELAQLAEGESVSFEPMLSDKYGAYVRLRDGASELELRALLQHEAPAVRVYAFHVLAERHPASALFAELSAALGDVAAVSMADEEPPRSSTVADQALERVERRLAGAERDAIARQLLTTGTPPQFAARIKREWPLGVALHEPLRELARRGDGDALRALARLRDPADIPLLVAALRAPTAAQALQAIGEFPDAGFVPALQAFQRGLLGLQIAPAAELDLPRLLPAQWRELRDPNAQVLCHFYATVLRFPAPVAEAFLEAPFARGAATADTVAHLTCQRWVLQPELIRQHSAAGFRLWEHNAQLRTEQLQVLSAEDPARARRLTLASAAELGHFEPDTAAWLLRQTEGAERAAALRALRASLRHAGKQELENLGDLLRKLELRELLPELFARLERSRPLADAGMATFREELTRPLVWQISRWPLNEAERQRLLSWVVGGRAARERDTKDPIGQRIVEEYLVDVLTRAGLLQADLAAL